MPFRKAGLMSNDETGTNAEPQQVPEPAAPVPNPAGKRTGIRKSRVRAGEAATPTAAEPDFQASVAALDSETPADRQSAIRSLEGNAQALPALAARLAIETEAPIREKLALVLSRAEGAEIPSLLLPHLRSQDAELRSLVAEILSHHPASIVPRLPDLLADDDPAFRIHILTIAKMLPVAGLGELLAGVLLHDPDVNVVAAALELVHDRQSELHFGDPQHLADQLGKRFPDQSFITFAVNRILKNSKSSQQ